MKSKIIKREQVAKPTNAEPNRTRWRVTAECGRCYKEFSKLEPLNTDKYCGRCEKFLLNRAKWDMKVQKLYGDKFLYNVHAIKSLSDIVQIRCKLHGEFSIKAKYMVSTHKSLQTGGCPTCVEKLQKTKNLKPLLYYKKILKKKSAGKVKLLSILDETKPILKTTSLNFICDAHGSFIGNIYTITNNIHCCAKCGRSTNSIAIRSRRTDVPGIVYFIKLKNYNVYKLGVSKDLEQRMYRLSSQTPIESIWTLEFSTLKNAYLVEQILFLKYGDYMYNGSNILKGGNTELLNYFIEKPTKGFVEEILRLTEPKTGNSDH